MQKRTLIVAGFLVQKIHCDDSILKTFSLRSLPGMLLLDLFLECSNARAARDALIENVGNGHTKKVFPDHTQIHRAFCPASLGSLSATRTGRRQNRNVDKENSRVRDRRARVRAHSLREHPTFRESSKRRNERRIGRDHGPMY